MYFDFLNFFAMIRTKSVETDRNSSRFPAILSDVKDLLRILHKWGSKNRPKNIKIIKIIMKNRFFIFSLETFLGHINGVGWSPACKKHVFYCFVTSQRPHRGWLRNQQVPMLAISNKMGSQKSPQNHQNDHEKSIFQICSRNVPGAPKWCGVVSCLRKTCFLLLCYFSKSPQRVAK